MDRGALYPAGSGVDPDLKAGRPHSEFDRATAAHTQHFVQLVRREGPLLRGAGRPDGGRAQLLALLYFAAEQANLAQALTLALSSQCLEWLLPLAEYFGLWHEITGAYGQRLEISRELLAAATHLASPELEYHAQLALGGALTRLGDFGAARSAVEQALGLGAQLAPRAVAAATHSAAVLEYFSGNYAAAETLLLDVQNGPSAAHELWRDGSALGLQAILRGRRGDSAASLELHQQAYAICCELGDLHGAAIQLDSIAALRLEAGELELAAQQFEQSLAMSRQCGDRNMEAGTLHNLAELAGAEGQPARARELYTASLTLLRTLGNTLWEAYCLGNMALFELRHGQPAAAAALKRHSLALLTSLGDTYGLVKGCRGAAEILVALGPAATAVTALHASCNERLAALYHIDSEDQRRLDAGQARFAAALAAGELAPEQFAQLQAAAHGYDLPALTIWLLAALNLLEEAQRTTDSARAGLALLAG